MLLSVLLAMTGCWWLLNIAPTAAFTMSVSFGETPLTVNFSAVLSDDPDGDIVKYEWDFGDGTSGDGVSVSHTYTIAGTLTVVLKVTDDGGKTARATKTLVVTAPADPTDGGAIATFTATPLTGESPLTVTFNAAASYHPIQGVSITSYTWDFGDGVTGTGVVTSHIYSPATTRTYHVVLTIIASDNTQATAEQDIIVTVQGPAPPTGAPTAHFTANPNNFVGPDNVTFDPGNSTATAGRTIVSYTWNYGIIGAPDTKYNDAAFVYGPYHTDQPTENFTVTLTVVDNMGDTDSYSLILVVKNLQPVAGFSVDYVPDGLGPRYPTTTTPLEIRPVAPATFPAGTNIPVTFESLDPTPSGGRFWNNGIDPLTKGAAAPDGINESAAVVPGNYNVTDKNLSYDVEGQSASDDGWGIASYHFDFDDGTSADSAQPVNPGNPGGGCTAFVHNFVMPDAAVATYNVTLTVTDERGGTGTLTRQIKIYRDP